MAAATIPVPTSGSSVLQQQCIAESSRLGPSIWRYAVGKSAWASLIPRGVWPDEFGDTYSAVNFRRSLAGTGTAPTWANHRLATPSAAATGNTPPDISNSATNNRGLPPVQVVQYTTQSQTIGLQWLALESPRFNVQVERFTWQTARQLEQIYGLLEDASVAEWARHTQQEYFRICATENRCMVNLPTTGHPSALWALPAATASLFKDFATIGGTGFTATLTGFGVIEDTQDVGANSSVLTGGVLRQVYAQMIAAGAGDSAMARSNGMPVFALITSAETSDYLHREQGTRDDIRHAQSGIGSAGDLLKPLGVERSLNGFAHVIDPWTPRFTLVDADTDDDASEADVTLTEVAKYSYNAGDTATGNGQGYWSLNSTYFTAPYEMSFIVVKDVMRTLVPPPKGSIGKAKFDPTQALGTFSFLNIPHEVLNPDGTMGFFRGVMNNATEPMKTEYGWCLIHRRPDPVYLATPTFAITSGLNLQS